MSFFVCLVCNQKCRLHSSNGSEPSQILSSCAILESDALPSWHYSTSLHGLEWRHHETIVCAPVAQWIAHQTSNLGVAGSSPAWGIVFWLQGEKYQLSHFWKHVRVIKGQAWNIIGTAHLCSNLLLLSFQFWLGLKPHILAQSLLRSPAMWFDFVCRRSNLIGFALCFFIVVGTETACTIRNLTGNWASDIQTHDHRVCTTLLYRWAKTPNMNA